MFYNYKCEDRGVICGKIKTRFVCQTCGYVSPRYLGRCPNCGEWNTLVEEIEESKNVQTCSASDFQARRSNRSD